MAATDESAALHRLQSALHDYLALGSGTPLYSEAKTMSTAVTHALAVSDPESPAEDTAEGGEESEMSGSSAPTDFRSARRAAKAVYGNGGNKGGSKTDESEQTQEDEETKKKGSRPF